MPRLCRIRLSSIGHSSARFDDLTLNFTNGDGRPANSTLWLRNGGGKTSLLSLFFAGVRPNKRDFLGQRAEQKIRRIEDYVAPRDHGVVVCEWELDAPPGLLDEPPPRYLSGVFYQPGETAGRDGDADVERLYFATLVSPTEPELTLDGLPLFSEHAGVKTRRSLHGFRRSLRQLDQAHPGRNVFVEDKSQGRFEEELASRGIDPQVFYYQILMNEREGGVSERFSFAEDEEFVDFLLEMTFDQRHARQVHEQLGTFRREILERNEQLKPELEYCRGLIVRLHTLVRNAHERADAFRASAVAQAGLRNLMDWLTGRTAGLQADLDRYQRDRDGAAQAAAAARAAADVADRLAAVHHRAACRLRRDELQADYEVAEGERSTAKRHKEIWQAGVPLARVWDARIAAADYRKLLEQKLQEFAPQLQELIDAATRFANALAHEAAAQRAAERNQRLAAEEYRGAGERLRNEASAVGERAAKDEGRADHLVKQLATAAKEEQLLRDRQVLAVGDSTVGDGIGRIAQELQVVDGSIATTEAGLAETNRQLKETKPALLESERIRVAVVNELERAQELWDRALAQRRELEADASLLRLLQTDQIDLEAASTGAAAKAADELRRVTDAILRIGVEAAEDERAIHELADTGLLPPTQDVRTLVDWLRSENVGCWSGWEYLENNVASPDRRTVIGRIPQIAAGVVVADRDFQRAADLCAGSGRESTTLRLRSPLVIAPAAAIGNPGETAWLVLGPTSDAHFDKSAGARELSRLSEAKARRQSETEQHQEWQSALGNLQHRLQQYLRDYPRGWFGGHRQRLEILLSRRDEAQQQSDGLAAKLELWETEADQARRRLQALVQSRSDKERDRDRLQAFERTFGDHLGLWRQDLAGCRARADKDRRQQADLREQARDWDDKSQQALTQATAAFVQAAQLESELTKVKHDDSARRQPELGPTEELRSRYELLLSDYEGKVNADVLNQLALAKDRDAEREEREFQQTLSRLPELTRADVEAELRLSPPDVTALQQLTSANFAYTESSRKLGPKKNGLNAAVNEFDVAAQRCVELGNLGPLPEIESPGSVENHAAQAARAGQEHDYHDQLAKEFDLEVIELDGRVRNTNHQLENAEKDLQRLTSIRTSHERQFERLAAVLRESPLADRVPEIVVTDAVQLVQKMDEIERRLNENQAKHDALDARREAAAKDVHAWSRQERFGKLRSSVSHRFVDREAHALETKAEIDIGQLNDCVFQIEAKLQEADKQRDIVIHVLSSAVDEALGLLARVSRMSRLPDSLPQAGKQFVKIETKASDNPVERAAHLGELIDELLERGDVGSGLELIQKAVRRVGRRITVRVLHPDLHQTVDRVGIADMRRFSGGERLTSAILLYCALMRLRQGEVNRRGGSSVLILDNPIGTASRLSFLDMQREVAQAMNVQLIYATAVKDLNAVGAMENVIRLRNTRADRRTGRRFIEVDGDTGPDGESVAGARVVFNVAPSSLVESNGHVDGRTEEVATDEAANESSRD